MNDATMIRVDNLVKRYGATLAVDRISFAVGRGEIVGFLGPNGAGKSTTMKILTGYLKATSGQVRVCGLDVMTQTTAVQKRIGYLPESAPAYQDMEVGAYLKFIAAMRGMWPKQAKAAIGRVLDVTGLTPRWRFPIDTLSRGYKQRVGLAAAMLHDPDVLILDEPTSGLDPMQIVEIRDVIRRIGEKKTVIFSTHIMQEVDAICNRVILIDHGHLLADGDFVSIRERAFPSLTVSITTHGDVKHLAATLRATGLTDIEPMAETGNMDVSATFTARLKRTDKDRIAGVIRALAADDSSGIALWRFEEPSLEDTFRHIVTQARESETAPGIDTQAAGERHQTEAAQA